MITFSRLGSNGQLANQMFQYATLVGTSKATGFDYGLNIYKSNDKLRCFVLDDLFEIDVKPFTSNIEYTYNEVKYHIFDKNIHNIPDQSDLNGYFQTEKYFEHCKDEIFRQFTIKKEVEDRIVQYGTDFSAIHIRRGDYLDNGFYYICDEKYVQRAIEIIPDTRYLIFSDDMGWCRQNLKDSRFEFMDINKFESFALMSKARNNIIANSSFSWWAAYLNKNPDKKVVIPKGWYRKIEADPSDMYLDKWIIV